MNLIASIAISYIKSLCSHLKEKVEEVYKIFISRRNKEPHSYASNSIPELHAQYAPKPKSSLKSHRLVKFTPLYLTPQAIAPTGSFGPSSNPASLSTSCLSASFFPPFPS